MTIMRSSIILSVFMCLETVSNIFLLNIFMYICNISPTIYVYTSITIIIVKYIIYLISHYVLCILHGNHVNYGEYIERLIKLSLTIYMISSILWILAEIFYIIFSPFVMNNNYILWIIIILCISVQFMDVYFTVAVIFIIDN